MKKIAFIGLGHMGLPMAKNLLTKGFDLTVFDLNPEAVNALVELGATGSKTLANIGSQDTYITMLQTGSQVEEVCSGSEGLFTQATEGSVFIDCSSIDVNHSRKIQKAAQAKGFKTIDAPVSGGVVGAENASLSFMVGGNTDTFQLCHPLLECMGINITHTGPEGTGQTAKICNNMILGVSMAAVSEAFILAKHLGLSAQKLFDVCQNASGQCWSLTSYCPAPGILENVPSSNDFKPGFNTEMMLKDLKLSQQAADGAEIKTPLGAHACELYSHFVASGGQGLDFSAIIKFLDREAL